MLYTVGDKSRYDRWIKENGEKFTKKRGGSVWVTPQEAAKHCTLYQAVYAVLADEKDTVPHHVEKWLVLTKDAQIVQMEVR